MLPIVSSLPADLDTTGAETLERLDDAMREQGIEMRLARIHRRARGQVDRSSLGERFEGRVYDRIHEAATGP